MVLFLGWMFLLVLDRSRSPAPSIAVYHACIVTMVAFPLCPSLDLVELVDDIPLVGVLRFSFLNSLDNSSHAGAHLLVVFSTESQALLGGFEMHQCFTAAALVPTQDCFPFLDHFG